MTNTKSNFRGSDFAGSKAEPSLSSTTDNRFQRLKQIFHYLIKLNAFKQFKSCLSIYQENKNEEIFNKFETISDLLAINKNSTLLIIISR